METLQFILIGLLIAAVVLLLRKSYYQLKAMETLDENDNDIYENIKEIYKYADNLANNIKDLSLLVEKDVKELNARIDGHANMEATFKEILLRDFEKVEDRFQASVNLIDGRLQNYAVANDMDLARIKDKVNEIEELQVELAHSFEEILTSIADLNTSELLQNLGSMNDTE